MEKCTMNEIAIEAEVSPATVSRVLNGTVKVSDELRKKVEETAIRRGYSIKRNKSEKNKNIGMIVPKLSNPFYSEIIEGILDTAAKMGYSVILSPTISAGLNHSTQFSPFLESLGNIAGIISFYRLQENSWFLRSLPEHMPVVQCCEYNEKLSYPFVSIDNYSAAYHAVSHLINMGRTKLAFFNSSCQTLYGRKREEGFLDAMAGHGLTVCDSWMLHLDEVDYNLALAAAFSLFSKENYPDGVFAVSDVYASGIIKGARNVGLAVPEDVSVVGFDDTEIALMNEPPLTTIRQPRYKIGCLACNILLQLIRTGSTPSQRFWVESDLIVRGSTRRK